jgi:hypothetical protein
MAGCLESYRICCRCATVDLPDCIISDVRPNSDFFSVLDAFLRHFSINMSQSDLAVVVLIFSGRRLNIKDSVGSVFGTVPVMTPQSAPPLPPPCCLPPLPKKPCLYYCPFSGTLSSRHHSTCLRVSTCAAALFSLVRGVCGSPDSAQIRFTFTFRLI